MLTTFPWGDCPTTLQSQRENLNIVKYCGKLPVLATAYELRCCANLMIFRSSRSLDIKITICNLDIVLHNLLIWSLIFISFLLEKKIQIRSISTFLHFSTNITRSDSKVFFKLFLIYFPCLKLNNHDRYLIC